LRYPDDVSFGLVAPQDVMEEIRIVDAAQRDDNTSLAGCR
jgi:hypothetical protein